MSSDDPDKQPQQPPESAEAKRPTEAEMADSASAPRGREHRRDDDEDEAGLDLDDLERMGVGGVVSQMREGDDEPVELPRRRRRSPVLSLVVIGFGLYLLANMWSDFSYWLSPREPTDLGHAADLVQDGGVPDGLDNEYVVLRGTPDVQHAARLTTKTQYVGYRRLIEGGGSLFVAIPRSKDQPVTNTFAGRFEGRMRTLSETSVYPWLEQFFEQEEMTEVLDSSAEALMQVLSRSPGVERIETEQGEISIGPDDRIRVVVSRPVVNVQLGKTSFPRQEDADAAIEALEYPSLQLERDDESPFYSYLVLIPPDERDAAEQQLTEGLDVPADNPDPRLGAVLLPRTATYLAAPSEFSLEDGRITFPYGDNTASPGYEVEDGKLVERSLAGGRVSIAPSSIRAVRVGRPIEVDPDGYVITVDATPASQRMPGILWLLVLGITGVNVVSLLLWWRRRHRQAAAQ